MKNILKKKIIGTSIYSLILIAIVFGIGSPALARYIQSRQSLLVDGVVVAVGASSLTIDTVGTEPIEMDTDSKTIFPSGLALAGIIPGDVLQIIAKDSGPGGLTARLIRKRTGSSYGFLGDQVLVLRGEVISKDATSFTIGLGNAIITFEVESSTRFVLTSFSSLTPGDTVQVIGRDSGSSFEARTVFGR